ncbi:MAG: diguanylate cyclase [Crocinitomicaceae bacterium]|nr:diguanylate cyclase [Crocinitomicaceae bacterium]
MEEKKPEIEQISDSVVKSDGFSYLIIDRFDGLVVEDVEFHDAVIIDGRDEAFVRQIVRRIRAHKKHDIYLKPVYILRGATITDPFIQKLTDGTLYSLDQLPFLKDETERIRTRSSELKFTESISFEAQMIEKVICFMYTSEDRVLEPIPYVYADINYSYPILSVNFSRHDEHSILDILEIAEKEGIFESEFHDKVYLCGNCNSGRLSYREVCPKCSSSNSKTQDIIHHFPCGYVGPIDDFTNEIDDELDCPKCNKRLRHIGVDYDKPSVLHTCNNCGHKFQDYNVNAKCMSCGQDQRAEQLAERTIKKYTLTKKGEMAAINGFVTTAKDIEEIIGSVKYETFKTMLKYEIERLRQTEGSSNVCAIKIDNPSQVYSQLGSDVQKDLLIEIVKVIRSNIRSSDIISFQNSSTIVLSMNEIPTRIAKKILSEIIDILKRLMETTLKSMEVQFHTHVIPLDYGMSPEMHIHQLTKELE